VSSSGLFYCLNSWGKRGERTYPLSGKGDEKNVRRGALTKKTVKNAHGKTRLRMCTRGGKNRKRRRKRESGGGPGKAGAPHNKLKNQGTQYNN